MQLGIQSPFLPIMMAIKVRLESAHPHLPSIRPWLECPRCKEAEYVYMLEVCLPTETPTRKERPAYSDDSSNA